MHKSMSESQSESIIVAYRLEHTKCSLKVMLVAVSLFAHH